MTGVDPYIVRYGSIFLLIVGTFGNILSFIIFTHGTLRKSSTFRYLALLSLMDLLVLYSGLLDLFLTIESGGTFSLRSVNLITCRLHTFITYWSQHSSSWILSFISVDRAVATNCIKSARKFCTPRSAEYIVGLILFLIALVNCHELIFLRSYAANPTEYRDDHTTISPQQQPFSSYEADINNKLIKKRSIQLMFSICDNPQWKFLCLRNKRDVSISNTTTNSIKSKLEIPVKKCEAFIGSRYEYFWDHVSSLFYKEKK
jgi:hypothetical protein